MNLKMNTNDDLTKSRAYIVIVLFLLSITFIIYILSKYIDLETLVQDNKPSTTNVQMSELIDLESFDAIKSAALDNDGDGAEDWRSIVGSTAEQNAAADNVTEEAPSMSSNFTALVSRDLYTASKYAEGNAALDNEAVTAAIYSSVEKLMYPSKIELKTIALNSTKQDIENYGLAMSYMFLLINSNELNELKEYRDASSFPVTRKFLKDVTDLCNEMKIYKDIPANYASLHIDFVYNCELYRNVLSGIVSGDEDIVKQKIAYNLHQQVFKSILSNIKAYSDALRQSGVVYDVKAFPTAAIYYTVK